LTLDCAEEKRDAYGEHGLRLSNRKSPIKGNVPAVGSKSGGSLLPIAASSTRVSAFRGDVAPEEVDQT
jgi:hypothetical protein